MFDAFGNVGFAGSMIYKFSSGITTVAKAKIGHAALHKGSRQCLYVILSWKADEECVPTVPNLLLGRIIFNRITRGVT